jgi:four helix bundle protein
MAQGQFRADGQRRGGAEKDHPRSIVAADRKKIESHKDLDVYQLAFKAACRIFEVSKHFPREETYSLTDQIRRSSRSVCTNLAEGWRRRRYEAAFVNKLNEAEGECAETQVWAAFAAEYGYISGEEDGEIQETYDHILRMLVKMIINPEPWLLPRPDRKRT